MGARGTVPTARPDVPARVRDTTVTSTTRVDAVVVTWNSALDVEACLASLLAQTHPVRVVVVDNGSDDDTVRRIERVAAARDDACLRLLGNPHNAGFSAAVNQALAQLDGDAVLLCNPDVRLAPDHVEHLVAALDADPTLGSVQGTLWRPSRAGATDVLDSTGHVAYRTRLFANRDEGRTVPSVGGRVFGVTGAACLHRRAMLDDIAVVADGGAREWLDETLFAYWDDIDIDWRARLRGWVAAHVPAAVGVHARGGASLGRSRHVEVLNATNRLLVIGKLDDRESLALALPGVVLGTVLKLGWLALRDPAAVVLIVRRLWTAWPETARRRTHAVATATVPPAVVAGRFESFAWRAWAARWWRRSQGERR